MKSKGERYHTDVQLRLNAEYLNLKCNGGGDYNRNNYS